MVNVLMPHSSASSQLVNVHVPVKYMKNGKLSIKPFSTIEEKDRGWMDRKTKTRKKKKKGNTNRIRCFSISVLTRK